MNCIIAQTILVWCLQHGDYHAVNLQDCTHEGEYIAQTKHLTKDVLYDIVDYRNGIIIVKELRK